MMQFRLIVPPAYESALGLMIGAGERDYRGKVWRAELWPGERPRLFKCGAPVALESAPRPALELIQATRQAFSA
jgi:hypothetical protein